MREPPSATPPGPAAAAWPARLLGIARELAQRVVLPTVLNEAKRPRHPLDIATRLVGLPFELAHHLRAAQQREQRRRRATEGLADPGSDFVFALHASELHDGERRVLTLGGQQVAVFRIEGRFYATGTACPHTAGPVAEGDLAGTELTCPWHGWRFDVPTGACSTVAGERLKTFPVKTVADQVLVRVA